MKIAVYGCAEYGIRIMKKLIEKKDVEQVVFVDNDINKIKTTIDNSSVVSIYSFIKMYHKKEMNKIIIPNYSLSTIRTMKIDLRKNGVKSEDVLIVQVENFLEKMEEFENFSDLKYSRVPYVQYISYEASESCNLNCIRCDHFSNLIDNEGYVSVDEFLRDINLLSSRIESVGTFCFLGGEPLLNRNLSQLIHITKKTFTDTQIVVLTNGLLIKQISDELIQAIKETDAILRMTLYPPLKEKIDDIVEFVRSKGIKFELSKVVDEFWTQINIKGDSDPLKMLNKCANSDCFVLKKGKLAKCPITMNVMAFNDYFDTAIPQDILDLSDDSLSIEEIHNYLYSPIETCKYCGREKYYEWERMNRMVMLEDMLCDSKIV